MEKSQFVHPRDWSHDRERPVVPPNYHFALAGTHWLEKFSFDGHPMGCIALQWQPGAKQWCHSDQHARGTPVNTNGWKYLCPIPLPVSDEDHVLIERLCDATETLTQEELNFVRRYFEQMRL